LLKKRVVSQIHTCEFGCPNCPFSCKLCFWSKNSFPKKKNGGKEESELKINKLGGKGKKRSKLLRLHNYEGYLPLPPLKTLLPPRPNYVNLYLHMVPKCPMRKIHP
jgi:hypothetical protein